LNTSAAYKPLNSNNRAATDAENPIDCQKQCAELQWARSFAYNSVTRECGCQDENAKMIPSNEYMVAGPPECQQVLYFDLILKDDLKNIVDSDHKVQLQFAVAVITASILEAAGNYTPYEGQKQLAPRPVMQEKDLRIKFGLATDGVHSAIKVIFSGTTRRVEYTRDLLSLPQSPQTLQQTVSWFIKQYGTSGAPDVQINVANISNVNIRPALDTSCTDTTGYTDEKGFDCNSWYAYQCQRATEDWGYSQEGEADILEKCPYTCETCDRSDLATNMKNDIRVGRVATWHGFQITHLGIGIAAISGFALVVLVARRSIGEFLIRRKQETRRNMMVVPTQDVEEPILSGFSL